MNANEERIRYELDEKNSISISMAIRAKNLVQASLDLLIEAQKVKQETYSIESCQRLQITAGTCCNEVAQAMHSLSQELQRNV
jgi:hypothetical protein